MKIVFLHGISDLYGASRCLVRLAGALRADGHTVEVWLPDNGPLLPLLEAGGATCRRTPEIQPINRGVNRDLGSLARFLAGNLPAAVSLAKKIRAAHPDLVHTNQALLLSAGLAVRLSGAPHLLHIREWFGEFPGFWNFYQRYLALFSDRIICVSRAVADQFHPALRNKVQVVYDGFPFAEFEAVTPARIQAFRDAFGLGGGPAVGVVGRIKWKRKGQEIFLQAAAQLRTDFPEARFLCIGSPFPGNESHLEALRRFAAELGMGREWIITGDVADNLGAIAALDVLVHPPCQPEPFSGAVVEAMALGKPVIGTDLGGTPEQVIPDQTGLLVPPNDADALADAMRTLLRDAALRTAMGQRGRERYRECFSWDPFYRSILREYGVVRRHPAAALPAD
jgi:glycosyltransferase involved in cell wall biosynthesis